MVWEYSICSFFVRCGIFLVIYFVISFFLLLFFFLVICLLLFICYVLFVVPELSQVAGGVGVFGPESGSKSVDRGQRARVDLSLFCADCRF